MKTMTTMNKQEYPPHKIRRAADRGTADHGWLKARFTFSFADYYDPEFMGFHGLRVMNNDTIAPSGGFPTHPHSNMEIFTYVIDGELKHEDSMGNGSVIQAGNLQYMSAGSGVTHSEFNPSSTTSTLLYQIWLEPNEQGGSPRYAEKPLGDQARNNALTLLFSGDGAEGSTVIRQEARISFGRLQAEKSLMINAQSGHPNLWLQVVSGDLEVFGQRLHAGDGIAVEHRTEDLEVQAEKNCDFLLFELT